MSGAVILAAGASRRMGSPKAFLTLGGLTFIERIAAVIRDAAFEVPMIATTHDDAKMLSLCGLYSFTPVFNAGTPFATPLGSIQAAVSAVINQTVDSLLVWPVDMPHVRSGTIAQLRAAFRSSGRPIVIPTLAGRRGHPVIFGREVFTDLMSADSGQGARAVVRADASRVQEVPVNDAAILDDIDTPEAYRDLLRRHAAGTLPL